MKKKIFLNLKQSENAVFSDFYSEESVNNQGLECLRFLNEVISDFDAVRTHHSNISYIDSVAFCLFNCFLNFVIFIISYSHTPAIH